MTRPEAIVIGGSAGALEALTAILPALPATYPAPIALVLHVLSGKPSLLADLLAQRCALKVCEAMDKQPLEKGTLYVAPPDYHLLIERDRCCALSVDTPVHFSRPSIDVLFESAAEAYRAGLVGVLLTGGNEDGARGLERIGARGGATVVQDPSTAMVPYMPESALKRFTPTTVLAPADIGIYLAQLGGRP
ncbi:MAG: chemotaxis protein CheB [Archangiaceae bacterium]|nr:chemotaxis protein CheB [Archangiaceae bacterium]